MARKMWWMGMLLVVLSSTGCCRWCEHWCGQHHGYAQPVAYAPQQCVPCCPVPCCPSSPAPVQQPWQRGPYGSP